MACSSPYPLKLALPESMEGSRSREGEDFFISAMAGRKLTPTIGTGLRISESLGLKWMDIDFAGQQIFVRRTWIQEKVGRSKTAASASAVPMAETLATIMNTWKKETPYPGEDDWVFLSLRKHGRQPREGAIAGADYLRPAAIKAGVIP
jgi:integrase